jgi:alkylation response protein AidB-like acyl-CoA dehydrogenase
MRHLETLGEYRPDRHLASLPRYGHGAGFTKSYIPAEYGGAGFSMLDLAIAAEELSCVDVNVPTTLLATRAGPAAGDPVRHAGAGGTVPAAVRR